MNVHNALRVMAYGGKKQLRHALLEIDEYADSSDDTINLLRELAGAILEQSQDNQGSARIALISATGERLMVDQLLTLACEFIETNLSVNDLREFAERRIFPK